MGDDSVNTDRATVRELQELVAKFNVDRGWEDKHSVRSLSEALVIECAELLELSLWDAVATERLHELRSEIADIGIYLLSLANHLDLDLADVIVQKAASNQERFPSSEGPASPLSRAD